MATKKTTKSIITNADTLARRAWVDAALSKVRAHLDVSAFAPSTLESLGHDEPVLPELLPAQSEPRAERRKHGTLYVAWSEGERRSGT